MSSTSSVVTTSNNIRKDDNDDGGSHKSKNHTNTNYKLESNKNMISNKSPNPILMQTTIPLNEESQLNPYTYNNTIYFFRLSLYCTCCVMSLIRNEVDVEII